jgi:hypothetical protein
MAHSPTPESDLFENQNFEMDYARIAAENVPYDDDDDREAGSSKVNVLIGSVAVGAVFFAGMWAKDQFDWFKKIHLPHVPPVGELVQPHHDFTVEAQAALNKVTMPGSIILVEGQGTAHAHMSYAGGFGPRTSWNLFNTSQTADSVFPSVKDQIILQGGDIKLTAKHREGAPADKDFYIDAQLDVSTVDSQVVGQPVTSTNENWQASANRIFHSVDEGSEGDVTAAIGKSNFQNACGAVLTPLIPSGIQAVVYKQLYQFEYLAQQEPNGQGDATASWLEQMRTAPMQIEYVQKVDGSSSQVPASYTPVSIANFKLPQVPADTKESFAKENGVKVSDLKDWQVDTTCHESASTDAMIKQWSYQNNPNVKVIEPSPTAEALNKQ